LVVNYEHAWEERHAQFARALNTYTKARTSSRSNRRQQEIAHVARVDLQVECELPDLSSLIGRTTRSAPG
jgi:hypothetical protein